MNTSTTRPKNGPDSGRSASPVLLSFATQKGGMGKTTLSVLVASTLHYKRGIKVALLDVDGSQLSVFNQRVRESKQVEEDEDIIQKLDKQDIRPYDVKAGNPLDVPQLLKEVAPDVQLVIVDLPGNIDVPGYDKVLAQLDHLIVPMETSEYSVTTGITFINAIKQIGLLPMDRIKVIWNKYKPSRDGELVDILEERFKSIGLTCLKSRVPQRDSYQDAINRSTLFPMPTNYLKNSGLKDLFTEIETLTSLTPKPVAEDEQ